MTEILRNPSENTWDTYACINSAATFSHRFTWGESLGSAYRIPVFRLAAKRCSGDQSLVGILPLMLFAAPDRAVRLISLPYTDATGIVADDATTGTKLLAAALDLADELGAVHVELRQAGSPIFHGLTENFGKHWSHAAHTFKTGLRRYLPESPDELWSLLPAKVRNQVRKARRCGCTVRIGGSECVEDFYAVFSENMRDLGSPVHAPDLFRLLLREQSLGSRVVVVSLAARPVAAAIVFADAAVLYNPWASSLRCFRPFSANMLLYWAMLELAVSGGCRWFDFGRSSPDATTCRFKRQWGADLQPLVWHVFSRKPHSWDPRSETLVDESWKSLDLAISRRDGPARRRWISL